MADIFEGVSTDLLKDYESLLKSYYLALNPDTDVSSGSVIHELVIRPAAAIYARNEVSLDTLKKQYSLHLLASSDDPDEKLAENLAANFKVLRKDGTNSTGTLAVYTDKTTDLYLNKGATLTAGGCSLEFPYSYVGVMEDQTDTDGIKYRKMIKTGDAEYAFLVGVKAVDVGAKTVAEGTPAVLAGQNNQILRMEIASAVGGGTEEESASDLVDRVIHGITARVPSGRAHIKALLTEQNDVNVYDLAVMGMGDPEMLRDRNNPFLIGTGGRVDVYVKTSQLPATTTLTKTATSPNGRRWTMFLGKDDAPGWYFISKITHEDNTRTLTDDNEFTIAFSYQNMEGEPEVFSADTARYSPYQTATVSFDYEGPGGTEADFLVTLAVMPSLVDLQEILNAPNTRNKQQDNLLKGVVPAYVGMDMSVRCLSDCSSVDLDKLSEALAAYVNSLPMGRGFLSVADLAVVVNLTYPNLTLNFPTALRLATHMPDGSTDLSGTTEGVIHMKTDVEQGVSKNNTAFCCRTADVSITIKA